MASRSSLAIQNVNETEEKTSSCGREVEDEQRNAKSDERKEANAREAEETERGAEPQSTTTPLRPFSAMHFFSGRLLAGAGNVWPRMASQWHL